MISLCLQCWPGDMPAALELAQLICDLEPTKRSDTEFFLVYRKDCPLELPKHFNAMAGPKFARAQACMARNHDVGWAGGCNMLAFSAFVEIALLHRQGICQNEAFLLFEPDSVPMTKDWLDQLSAEWERVKALGKEAYGHYHMISDLSTIHLNGNAVFRTDFWERHPDMMIGPATQGWDYFYREKYVPLSVDSNYIYQHWGRPTISQAELAQITKNGMRPALFHGVKDGSARVGARAILLSQVPENQGKLVQVLD